MAGTLNSMFNQQPQGKQVRLPSGEMAVFPADMPDDAIANNITQFQTQQQRVQEFDNQHPLAKGLMQLVGPQFGFQPPTKDEFQIPVVPGNTFGMTPETLNSTLGVIQNTQNMNAAERIRQRVQLEKEMEQEKDRAQQLKLEQQRMKNEQMIEKMRLQREEELLRKQGESQIQQEKIKAESAAARDQSKFTQQMAIEQMRLNRPMVVGGESVVFNPSTGEFFNADSGQPKPNLQRVQTDAGIFVFDQNNPTQPAVKVEGVEGNMGSGQKGAASEFQIWQMREKQRQVAEQYALNAVKYKIQVDTEQVGKSEYGIIDPNGTLYLSDMGRQFTDSEIQKRLGGGGAVGNLTPNEQGGFTYRRGN